ncbi:YibE/F family protein [Isoptericola sp. b441]|uniref:YibE/F family protein n=1 Tax=Actinotalea lenta TaxID=3064654 RepID=A0ABT9DB17_9CELL|nr:MULTISPECIES: YibE/F family protein [unclassified Isoptericola]MDO8108094.1 YibE/F family protein [Isoptericola sp. b441]MDO8120237.1 YibE/F family protein [Isoptericola sp. b490]
MPRRPDRTSLLLAAILVPFALATALGLVLLRPTGAQHTTGVVDTGADYPLGTVVAATDQRCQGTNEDRLPDGTIPATVPCTQVTVALRSGRQVDVWGPSGYDAASLPAGTRVVIMHFPASDGQRETFVWHDFDRTVPLGALAAAFALVVVVVAGVRGLRALVGLALAFGVIGWYMLPALLDGRNPVAVGLVGAATIMVVVLYLAHGFSRRTTTALLGTLAGLLVSAGLGTAAAVTTHLTGIATEDGYRLAQLTGQLDGTALRGIVVCGMVLAGLGVLNDVTITQASAVWELHAAAPHADRRTLFGRAMRIGRDHIASTVYTIAFAYAGAALPVLMLLEIYRLPLAQTMSSGAFAEEITRTLVGSIGLVLAIPLTTALAVAVVSAAPPHGRHSRPEPTAHHAAELT